MQNEFISPLTEATKNIITSIVSSNVIITHQDKVNSGLLLNSIGVCIGITGELHGQVLFLMEEKSAFNIISKLTMMTIDKFDEISKSAICELCNMIMGNAASIMFNKGTEIDITTPAFLKDDDLNIIHQESNDPVFISFDINQDSKIDVEVYISNNE